MTMDGNGPTDRLEADAVMGTCDADAGTITPVQAMVCLDHGLASIAGSPDGNSNVPFGFETMFLLSQGGVVLATRDSPEFDVTSAGTYVVHTLVFDPNTYDIASIEVGVTTVVQIDVQLVQGGGETCAALDIEGASIIVQECIDCEASAGTITAVVTPVCLVAGSATIGGVPDGNVNIPFGYDRVYLWSSGPNAVIGGLSFTPSFTVTAIGVFTIHTFVHDANTFTLSSIQAGTTTIQEVNLQIAQGGGAICAALDLVGAAVTVESCTPCTALSGTMTAVGTPVCLLGGTAEIGAVADGNAVVPTGSQTVYLLSFGSPIVQLSASPDFTVTGTGSYAIHALVYDPASFNTGSIQLGITTVAGVSAQLTQGGGTSCGSVDIAGATIDAIDCGPENDDCADAIGLAVNLLNECPGNATMGDNTDATMDGGPSSCGDPVGTYLDVWYAFNSGPNVTIRLNFDHGTMEDWSIVVSEGCGGNEVVCVNIPTVPVVITTVPNTNYRVRVYSSPAEGEGGQFSICLLGTVAVPVCNGGAVQAVGGATSATVCQNAFPDVIDFATSSTTGGSYDFILTDATNAIISVIAGGSMDFNPLAVGVYRVWGVGYAGTLENSDPGSPITGLTSSEGCIGLSTNSVQVIVEICTGINEHAQVVGTLFPNPGDGDVNFLYAGADGFNTVTWTDVSGRIVHQESMNMAKGRTYNFTLAGRLASGVYAVRMNDSGESSALRMVVR